MQPIRMTLKRIEETKDGMFGELYITDEIICHTLELPWRENEDNISCIPAGTYKMTVWDSPAHGRCFKIHDVPDRDDILVHVGNLLVDTIGCVLVGKERGSIWKHGVKVGYGIRGSLVTLKKLLSMIGDDVVELTITKL
jgi:hypothetical protein